MAPVPAPQKTGGQKAYAYVALIGLGEEAARLIAECFKQFGIETAVFSPEDAPARFKREKYEACVLSLKNPNVENLLADIRRSTSTQRMVVYGICATMQEALRFSKYGVNATFNDPLDRQNLLRVIRATHLLVLHELRRYVRIPIVAEVQVRSNGTRYSATMIEVSGGGLSMQSKTPMNLGEVVEVAFALPNAKEVSLRGTIVWIRPDAATTGVRYDVQDPNREAVKSWIDDYLDIE
jgi:Tfp pilus assembly protein PilZ